MADLRRTLVGSRPSDNRGPFVSAPDIPSKNRRRRRLKTKRIFLTDPPTENKFTGPSYLRVQAYMILKNPSDEKVAFKIKTTAPNACCVRQICGLLDPQHQAKILVTFQPCGYDANECDFLKLFVKSVFIDPLADYGEDGKTFPWKDIEDSRIMYSQLQWSFEAPSLEQLFEIENMYENTVNAETDLQKADTEDEDLLEVLRQKEILLTAAISERLHILRQLKKNPHHYDIQESKIVHSTPKCSFEKPSLEPLFESENIHEATTNVLEVNSETDLQKAAAEVEELREEMRQKQILFKALILERVRIFTLAQKPSIQKRPVGGNQQFMPVLLE